MNILLWIIFGGLAGWIASLIMGSRQSIWMDILVGIVGALLGGWLFSAILGVGITGFNLVSLLIAIVGAIVLIAIVRAIWRPARSTM